MEFKLTYHESEPCIEFVHQDKSNNLEELLLKDFIKKVKERGLRLTNPSGGCGTNSKGEYFSHEKYRIVIDDTKS